MPPPNVRPHSQASATADVEFLIGFELEFILLKSTDPITPISEHTWSASEGLYSGTLESKVLEEIVLALQAASIDVQMYHAEAAPGQVRTRYILFIHSFLSKLCSTKS